MYVGNIRLYNLSLFDFISYNSMLVIVKVKQRYIQLD
jgi:hypothetical protein